MATAARSDALKLAAIVFTDIVGYSAVVHRDGAMGKRLLDRQSEIIRKKLGLYGGREVETAGDSFLLLFDSTVTALGCLAEIHCALIQANKTSPAGEPVQLRACIHLGDVELRGAGVFGDDVNVASRILPFSPVGGIALSDLVQRQLRNRLGTASVSIGSPPLKNIEQAVEIFVLDATAVAALDTLPPTREAATPDVVHPSLHTTQLNHKESDKPAASLIWSFGKAQFDERALELTLDGEPVEIERKPLEVLRHLLWHAGEVVTRDELLDAVWPGRVLSESVINKCISRLREVLKDDDQRLIKTAHGYGYRLIAEVQVLRPQANALPPPRFDFKPGDHPPMRPQWKLKQRLGAGGHGEAWLAEHEKTHELRVYKFAFDDGALLALKREITLYRLLHDTLGERPDFVKILDWNLSEAPFFTEAEYMQDGNLLIWAERSGGIATLPLTLRIELLAQIAETLAAAHSVGVLHKDIKPSNVLVVGKATETPGIKLMDFGSGGVMNPNRLDELGITQLGFTQLAGAEDTTSGTPLYMAPEVMVGHPVTVLADIYALGVMLYQLVIGDLSKPLASGWEQDIADALLREDIADATQGNPQRRLADAASLAHRLRSLDARRAERVLEQQQRERSARAARNYQELRRLRVLAAALLVLVVISVGASVFAVKARNRAQAAEQDTQAALKTSKAVSDFLTQDLLASVNPDTNTVRDRTLKDVLLLASEKVDQRLAGEPGAAAEVHYALGLAYRGLDLQQKRKAEQQKAAALFEQRYGANAEQTLNARFQLGIAEKWLGNLEAAIAIQQDVLVRQEKLLGADNPEVLTTRLEIFGLKLGQGDWQSELVDCEKIVGAHRKAKVPAAQLQLALLTLADAQTAVADYAAAEKTLREILATERQQLSQGYFLDVRTRGRLAGLLVERGQYSEAAPILKEAQLFADKSAVTNSFSIFITVLWAQWHADQDQYQQALPLAKAAAEHVAEALAQGSSVQLQYLPILAEIYQRAGRADSAQAIWNRILPFEDKLYAIGNPLRIAVRATLADGLRLQGRRTQAWDALRAIPAKAHSNLPDRHPIEADFQRTQGLLWLAEGQFVKAREALQRSLNIYQFRLGDAHWRTRRAKSELAQVPVT